jgi:hypothetical protein
MSKSSKMRGGWFLLVCFQTLVAQVAVSGHVQNWTAKGFQRGSDYTLERDRLRINLTRSNPRYRLFFSGELVYSVLGKSSFEAVNRESYLDFYGRRVDVRIGKQKVVWGLTNGLFLNDIVSPLDLRYFLMQDLDDIRLGTLMARMIWYGTNWSMEGVWLPEFSPGIRPGKRNPWAGKIAEWVYLGFPVHLNYMAKKLPVRSLENGEFGFRSSLRLKDLDLWFYLFRGFQDEAVYDFRVTEWYPDSTVAGSDVSWAEVWVQPRFEPLTMVGLDVTFPVNVMVIRGEFGFFQDYAVNLKPRFNDDRQSPAIVSPIVHSNLIQGMIGVDVTGPFGIGISTQVIHKQLLDYQEGMWMNRYEYWGTFSVKGLFFAGDGSSGIFILYDLRDPAGFFRWSNSYRFEAGFLVEFGLDILWGDGTNWLGQYDLNDNYFFKVTYSF